MTIEPDTSSQFGSIDSTTNFSEFKESKGEKKDDDNGDFIIQLGDGMEEYVCRICLEESSTPAGMIAPCMCSGTAMYVHAECLNHWREASPNPLALTKCLICKTNYNLKTPPKHNLHNFCIGIDHNFLTIYIMQQSLSIFGTCSLSLLINPDMSYNTFDYFILVHSYLICVSATLLPCIAYTMYVLRYYTTKRRKVCIESIKDCLPPLFPCLTATTFTYLIFPELMLFMTAMSDMLIMYIICKVFKHIHKSNRTFRRDQILNMERRMNPI